MTDKKKYTDEELKNLADRLYKILDIITQKLTKAYLIFYTKILAMTVNLLRSFKKNGATFGYFRQKCNEIFEAEQKKEEE